MKNMKRYAAFLMALLMLAGLLSGRDVSTAFAAGTDWPEAPEITAEAAVVMELSTGNIAELKPASAGNAKLMSIGKTSVRSYEQNNVTAAVPAIGDEIDRNIFCYNCLGIIDRTPNEGYRSEERRCRERV